jgi:hypothetical protein
MWHLHSSLRHLNPEPGPNAPVYVGAPSKRIAINITGPYSESKWKISYLLIAIEYFTRWLEVYVFPNQESSVVAYILVTNFLCLFGVPGAQWPMLELQVTTYRGGVMTSENLDDMHISAPMVGCYVRAVEKQLKVILMCQSGLEWKATLLTAFLQGISPQDYRPELQLGAMSALWPAV